MKQFTKELTLNGQPIKIHAISTGKIGLKSKAMHVKNPGTWSTLMSFRDKNWAEWMSIWCWVVEHPEGTFLIDTGDTAEVNEPNYYKSLGGLMNYYFTKQMRYQIERKDEIDVQLKELGLQTSDIDKILLTHLHVDHTGGLKHFEGTPALVNRLEEDKPHSVFKQLLPSWFEPTLVDVDAPFEAFSKSAYLTEDKTMLLVHTPGHTFGHSSILLKTDEGWILFAGDLVYNEEQVKGEGFSATVANKKDILKSLGEVKAFAKNHKLVFLPSHDVQAVEKLDKMIGLDG